MKHSSCFSNAVWDSASGGFSYRLRYTCYYSRWMSWMYWTFCQWTQAVCWSRFSTASRTRPASARRSYSTWPTSSEVAWRNCVYRATSLSAASWLDRTSVSASASLAGPSGTHPPTTTRQPPTRTDRCSQSLRSLRSTSSDFECLMSKTRPDGLCVTAYTVL